ncbi:GNAT family N-acetyltransferase [Engelhardtia mirabilis]|uniref:Ribosomal N-acetyltransferase YdaF n=1 Tax=Engelhardtia mirabilis TaxID=2528011 RepID=A0A518BR17_9BACT|nr:Putative ribosomal N-acetyltransferase YdaF [Planctomycetes bacterium Pla133]QDV03722.1 Putative ribosomal N-acetyltransferase YdaF [Planctomycetes bacterium Pla86]
MSLVLRPAYRIQSERLTIRCYEPSDAPQLRQAMEDSVEHLLPWMAWARDEPAPMAEIVVRIRRFRAQFDMGMDFIYAIFDGDQKLVGGTGLHPRIGPGCAEIGYWIRAGHTRLGYATEAAAALTRVGFVVHGYRKIEIRVVPQNEPSVRIPRGLGYRFDGLARSHVPGVERTDPWRDAEVHSLLATEFIGGTADQRSRRVSAFDCTGEPLLTPAP